MISFGLVLLGQPLDLVVVDQPVLGAHAVLHGLEPLARHGGLGTVGEVAAGVERHAEDGVAGLEQGQHDRPLAWAPECGWTLAKPQPNSRLARSIASVSATSTCSQPP